MARHQLNTSRWNRVYDLIVHSIASSAVCCPYAPPHHQSANHHSLFRTYVCMYLYVYPYKWAIRNHWHGNTIRSDASVQLIQMQCIELSPSLSAAASSNQLVMCINSQYFLESLPLANISREIEQTTQHTACIDNDDYDELFMAFLFCFL